MIDQDMAVLFLDVRFEQRDPVSAPDAIYVLGQFQAVFTTSIERMCGLQCRHTGASWMALFGAGMSDLRKACLQAVDAARDIETRATGLVVRLARELAFQVEFSVGVHVGPATVLLSEGDGTVRFAFGDGLQTAALLQDESKLRAMRFVLSDSILSVIRLPSLA